jgi:hypothetical protein
VNSSGNAEFDLILSSQIDLTTKLEAERQREIEIEQTIAVLREEILDLKEQTRHIGTQHDVHVIGQREQRRLMRDLDILKSKKSMKQKENKDLKDSINSLRRERIHQRSIKEKAVDKIRKCNNKIRKVSLKATKVLEEKNQLKSHMTEMKRRVVREMEDFVQAIERVKGEMTNNQDDALEGIEEVLREIATSPERPSTDASSSLRSTQQAPSSPSPRTAAMVSTGHGSPNSMPKPHSPIHSPPRTANRSSRLSSRRDRLRSSSRRDRPDQDSLNSSYMSEKDKNSLSAEGFDQFIKYRLSDGTEEGGNLTNTFYQQPGVDIDYTRVVLHYQELGAQGRRGEISPDELADEVTRLEAAIEEICKKANVARPGDLLQELIQNEESNFTFYKEMLEMNREIEELKLKKSVLKDEMKIIAAKVLVRTARNSKQKRLFEARINQFEEAKGQLQDTYVNNMEIIETISPYLMEVYQSLMDDQEDVEGNRFLETGLSDRNLLPFLGQIEDKLDRLVHISNGLEQQEWGHSTNEFFSIPEEGVSPGGNTFGESLGFTDTGLSKQFQKPNLPTIPVSDSDSDSDEEDVGPGSSQGFRRREEVLGLSSDGPNISIRPVNIGMLKSMKEERMSKLLQDEKAEREAKNQRAMRSNQRSRRTTTVISGESNSSSSVKEEDLEEMKKKVGIPTLDIIPEQDQRDDEEEDEL